MTDSATIHLQVNGKMRAVLTSRSARLLDVLRGPMELTGTKEGCGEGECGACTVLFDGEPANACLLLVGQAEGHEITTIEGLAAEGVHSPAPSDLPPHLPSDLSVLQQCFIEDGGTQCGMCTPGMIVAAEALLTSNPQPSDDEIREGIAGNICRCTGYQRIVNAIRRASELRP